MGVMCRLTKGEQVGEVLSDGERADGCDVLSDRGGAGGCDVSSDGEAGGCNVPKQRLGQFCYLLRILF